MDTEEQIIKNFSQKMLEKIELRHDRYAPMGWKTLDLKRLLFLLKEELKEIENAVRFDSIPDSDPSIQSSKKQVADEAVDVANYAMFIYELSK